MKIITPGERPEDKTYRLTCRNCKCVFEFRRKEATYHSDQREGAFLSIPCPYCEMTATTAVST